VEQQQLDEVLAGQVVLAAAEDDAVLRPAYFSNQWCETWLVAVFEVELAHQPDVLRREPVAPREFGLQVAGEVLDHGSPPAQLVLLAADRLSHLPVQCDQLVLVFRESGCGSTCWNY